MPSYETTRHLALAVGLNSLVALNSFIFDLLDQIEIWVFVNVHAWCCVEGSYFFSFATSSYTHYPQVCRSLLRHSNRVSERFVSIHKHEWEYDNAKTTVCKKQNVASVHVNCMFKLYWMLHVLSYNIDSSIHASLSAGIGQTVRQYVLICQRNKGRWSADNWTYHYQGRSGASNGALENSWF
jgi:hypothetical protein